MFDRGYIASKYVSNPHLINGYKYDLRLYVLVSSFDPLVVYLYNDGTHFLLKTILGLVRFATEKYSKNFESLSKRFVHLTNYSVNKYSEKYVENNLEEVVLSSSY